MQRVSPIGPYLHLLQVQLHRYPSSVVVRLLNLTTVERCVVDLASEVE